MSKRIKVLSLFLLCSVFLESSSIAQEKFFKNWPKGTSPKEIGVKLTQHFIASPHTNFGAPGKAPWLTYPDVCTWYGALNFSKEIKDKSAVKSLEERYIKLIKDEKKLIPNLGHVDNNVFGALPFQLYIQTKKKEYLKTALPFADKQWELPSNPKPAYQKLFNEGYSWQTRLWIDDMYMITLIQAQAYRATGKVEYINRAAKQMVMYLDSIQRPNGLFYHAPDVPFFWGRGNGWMAAGMTELLLSLPKNNPDRPRILEGYLKMMSTLKQYQTSEGMWLQLIDDDKSWAESSGTAMFTYAIISGVKEGWLSEKEFGPVARKGWLGLVSFIDEKGNVKEVCQGTNKKNDRQHYIDRKRIVGDMHGQAPALWCAFALLN